MTPGSWTYGEGQISSESKPLNRMGYIVGPKPGCTSESQEESKIFL